MTGAETVKNREAHTVGTRVKNAFHKVDVTYGTVVGYDEQSGHAVVQWDSQRTPVGGYRPYELKAV